MSAEDPTPKQEPLKPGETIYFLDRLPAPAGELYGPWVVKEAVVQSNGLTDLRVRTKNQDPLERDLLLNNRDGDIFRDPVKAKQRADEYTERQKEYPPPHKVF